MSAEIITLPTAPIERCVGVIANDHWAERLRPRFGEAAADRAYQEWRCNCGPTALAAICGLTLDEVRPHMRGFEGRGYTNPTMMLEALNSIGATYKRFVEQLWPGHGLCRVQWEGPWTQPGVPIRARYRYTHWIGCHLASPSQLGIFDVNCLSNGSGWVSFSDWEMMVVPWLLKESVPRANGKWSITHRIEVLRA